MKITTEIVISKFKNKHGDRYGYSKVSYSRNDLKVIIICKKHAEFEQSPKDHASGRGCPDCSKEINSQLLTLDLAIKRFKNAHGEKYDYSKVFYVSSKIKVKISCHKHGYFLQTPAEHIKGKGCAQCAKENNNKHTTESIIKKFKSAHNDLYDYSLVNYVKGNEKVIIICKRHGEFLQVPTSHYRGNGCPQCVEGRTFYTYDTLVEKFNSIHHNVYDYSKVVFLKVDKRVTIKCKIHGDFQQTPHSHLQGNGCPTCSSSKGELRIRKFLISKKIQFQEQYPICKNPHTGATLRTDFYIPSLNMCIEYDGIQHFEKVKCFGGDVGFENTQKRDKLKNEYCKTNNIKMLRIPYFKQDCIEEILDSII